MSIASRYLLAAALFVLATLAGLVNLLTNDGSWTLVVIPLGLLGLMVALWAKYRRSQS